MRYLRNKKNKLIKNRLANIVDNLVTDRGEGNWEAERMAASEAWTAEERISKLGVCQQKLLNPKGKENKE